MITDILQPVPFQGDEEIIQTINNDFLILAKRIKKLNEQYSYWDMMRIAEIFSSDINPDDASSNSGEEEKRQIIYQQFISTTWARLPNYSGAYIRLTAPNAYFTLDTNKVRNGDYVIKLPGSEFLYIPGPAGATYYPHSTDDPFNIVYDTRPESSDTYTFTIPTVVGSNLCAASSITVPPGATLSIPNTTIPVEIREARWYVPDTGEEVVWDNSFIANTNITSMTLMANYLYKRNDTPTIGE